VRGTWNREYLDDMCAFPQGKHDHYTDASSRAFNRLAGPSGWNPADLAALSRKKPI
jgi:phage terminase large subunit-like protein